MKTVKRILAVLLTVCMVMGLAVTVVAAETGNLTIDRAIPGATYNAYKMLDIEQYTAEATPDGDKEVTESVYYILAGSDWFNFFVKATPTDGNYTAATVAAYVEVSKADGEVIDGKQKYYVEWKETANTEAAKKTFAESALTYAKVSITGDVPNATAGDATVNDGTTTVEIKNLPFGYYLIDTNGGSFVSLDTFAPDVVIEEKNTAPVVEKKVKDERDGSADPNWWQDDNTASIGDTVSFKTTITVGTGATNYVLHDSMTGLDFANVSSVKLYATDGAETNPTYTEKATLASGIDYTVTSTGLTDETVATGVACDFEVEFKDTIFGKNAITVTGTTDTYTIKEGDQLVVEYTATLNKDAAVGPDTGNPNKTLLAYGVIATGTTEPPLKTPPDETITYTYKFDLVKTDKKDVVLEGATFKLRPAVNGAYDAAADIIKFSEVKDASNNVTGYKVDSAGTIEEIPAGKATIIGLGKGTYYLTEEQVPTGYKKLTAAVPVEIVDANLDASVTSAPDGEVNTVDTWTNGGVHVINVKKSIFPHTGGIGVTVYYLAGGAIIALVAAAAVTVFKKRQNAKVK